MANGTRSLLDLQRAFVAVPRWPPADLLADAPGSQEGLRLAGSAELVFEADLGGGGSDLVSLHSARDLVLAVSDLDMVSG
jgi:hypothetical protein